MSLNVKYRALARLMLAGALLTQFCGGLGAQESRARTEDDPAPSVLRALSWERQVTVLTNRERAKNKLPPLKFQENLTRSARWLAQDMAENNYFAHEDRQGRSIDPRLPDFGYRGYHAIGENIAAGQRSPEAVVEGWMHSPHHRENILNPEFREIGIGYFATHSGKFHSYWVQDFGSRFDVYPIVINDGSGQTRTPQIALTIYGFGADKSGPQMRLSDDGVTWTHWEPYKMRRAWTLTGAPGPRTVYVEMRRDGETVRSADTVTLLPPASRGADGG